MKKILAIFTLGFAIVGCSPQATDVIPTLIPTPLPAVAATETPIPPVAPTQAPLERPTLPPTWTPSVEPTNTVISVTDTPIPQITAAPTLAACVPFDIDRNKSAATFTVGQPTQVFWVAVQGAARYRIGVLDGSNQEIFLDYSIEPSFTFPSDLFQTGKRYAWRVYPEDSLSRQMCFAVTGDMSPG